MTESNATASVAGACDAALLEVRDRLFFFRQELAHNIDCEGRALENNTPGPLVEVIGSAHNDMAARGLDLVDAVTIGILWLTGQVSLSRAEMEIHDAALLVRAGLDAIETYWKKELS